MATTSVIPDESVPLPPVHGDMAVSLLGPVQPMSLSLDAFREASGHQKGPRCTVRVLIESLPDKDSAALVDALAHPDITTPGIERELKKHGHKVGAGAVGKHRRGDCACTPTGKASR
jgi:hypothetical protein